MPVIWLARDREFISAFKNNGCSNAHAALRPSHRDSSSAGNGTIYGAAESEDRIENKLTESGRKKSPRGATRGLKGDFQ